MPFSLKHAQWRYLGMQTFKWLDISKVDHITGTWCLVFKVTGNASGRNHSGGHLIKWKKYLGKWYKTEKTGVK